MKTDFVIDETLYTSDKSTVYKARLKNDSKPLILKVAEGAEDISGLQNEINILKQYYSKQHAPRLVQYDHKPAMVRDYIQGRALRHILDEQQHGEALFKKISLPLVERLAELHNKGIIHKDVSPGNIIVDVENGTAEIIDFEIGSLTQQVHNNQYFSSGVAGNLLYISPEQTGRMNRSIDYRSDYYSLGIVFYEILTGRLPFYKEDALELIHCHIAQLPESIDKHNPKLSKTLAAIVHKLIAKQAEERYQSLAGLMADLEIYLSGKGDEKGFVPGNFDLPFHLKVSQKFTGREKEANVLHKMLDRTCEGDSCFLEVSGFSGVGKTRLVRESLKKLSQYKGLYISGKFEKVKTTTPFYGWISASNELASILMSESAGRQAAFRQSFEEEVGDLGGVITELCPRLELFYGKQKPMPELSAKEQQNRFFIATNKLLRSLTANGLPLVIFIDDWQWADDDSINLLANLVSDKNLHHTLIVSALRDNEVTAVHPYHIAVEELKKDEDDLEFLHLKPLNEEHVKILIQDTLKKTLKPVDGLAEVAFKKTQGNPYFLGSFFENIYSRKFLYINTKQQLWDWDMEAINQLMVSDDLAGMVVDKLKTVSGECFALLQKAAFFGNRFKLKSLARLEGEGLSYVHNLLWPAIQNCLIIPSSDNYKFIPEYYEEANIDLEFYFVHDKVQQACYSAYDFSGRPELHYRIGQILYDQGHTEEFDTAVHFINGLEVARQKDDQGKLWNLFLEVGNKAFRQSALETGYEYFRVANSIKPIESLQHFKIWIQCAFIGTDKESAMRVAETALLLYEDKHERFEIYEILIRSLETISENKTAIEVSTKALRELGFKLPKKASTPLVVFRAIQAKMSLNDKKIKRLVDFPEIEDPRKLALIRILNVSLGPFFLANENLYPLIIFKTVTIGSKYGNCPEITAGYSSFALSLAGIMNAWESAYMLGVESLKLVGKYQTYQNIAVCGFAFTGFVQHRKEPVRNLPDRFLYYYKKGLQFGEIIYGNWNLNFAHLYRFLLGHPMSEVRQAYEDIVKFNRQYKNTFDDRDLVNLEFFRIVTGDGQNHFMQFQDRFGEGKANTDPTVDFMWHMLKAFKNWLFEDFDQALIDLERCYALEEKMVGVFMAQFYQPFISVLAMHAAEKDKSQRSKYLKMVKRCRKALLKQQKYYDYNVSWMLAWIEAEEASIKNGKPDISQFEKAQAMAREAGFTFPSMMIGLHLFRQLKPQYEEHIAVLKASLNSLRTLEMYPVLEHYQEKYSDVLSSSKNRKSPGGKKQYSTELLPDIDLMTVIKATDALTGELNLEKLLYNMLSYIMQNTGARFGSFLLQRHGQFENELSLEAESGGVLTETSSERRIPAMVLEHVIQTKDTLILDNALQEKPYNTDPTIVERKIKSLFCVPFLHQGQITGIVYLSNSLMASVFNDDRIALTRLLAGQIAGSIENAILYEEMESLVEKRTEQLQSEMQKSDELLLNILPEEVAAELKESGKATPKKYETVTVLFTDFVGFTSHSEKMTPEELVSEIDKCYQAFDDICAKHGLEKIKTIGDAYMAAGGIPEKNQATAKDVILAAIDMRDFTLKMGDQNNGESTFFSIRIGIHTGPVVAGVVGTKKFQYDIWGNTVNLAARMEQNSEPGKVNISQATYDLVKDDFSSFHRGKIQAKNVGDVDMYFVDKAPVTGTSV